MKTTTGLQILLAVAAFAAAWFWMRASVDVAPEVGWDTAAALKEWLDSAARLNKIAAGCAGISALSSGMSHVSAWLRV
jgi:hypothetical protein